MSWSDSLSTHIWIFCIGRGIAAFVRTGLNQGFIIDMGRSDDFDPAGFLEETFVEKLDPYKKNKVAQVILSHPHSDHIAQSAKLRKDEKLYPTLLTSPHDKTNDDDTERDERLNWDRIENPEGTEELIQTYRKLYEPRTLPLQTINFDSRRTVPNLEYGIYYVRPPICESLHETDDNKYGNSTSIMFYLRHGSHTILFPGDMTPEGMKHVLDEEDGVEKRYTQFNTEAHEAHPEWHEKTSNQPSLKSVLANRGLSILVAPHHGLESGYSEDLYGTIRGKKPELVVISERRHRKPTDGKIHPRYQSEDGASGLTVEIDGKEEKRRSLSTVNGQHILIVFAGTGRPRVYADKDPEKLLEKADE